MYSFLLRKALPFTLTFVFGAALSGLLGLFGSSGKKAESFVGTRTYKFSYSCGGMRRHNLVAESKPLQIIYTPEARYPGAGSDASDTARVNVTFGSDGEVKAVKPLARWYHGRDDSLVRVKAMWDAVETAARGIRFTPETINGIPVTVEREVEISFASE